MTTDPRIIDAPKAPPNFDQWDERVHKVVLGQLDGGATAGQWLPDDLAARFPHLTHLYVWCIAGLSRLPPLPDGLQCLDVRGCDDLEQLPELPPRLERLIVEECPKLRDLRGPAAGLPQLVELSLRGSKGLAERALQRLVSAGTALEVLDLSGCAELTRLPQWAVATLCDVRLNDCAKLGTGRGSAAPLPPLPEQLRRLELKGTAVVTLPDVPSSLDYLDVRSCERLTRLPQPRAPGSWRPRTLYVHGSGLRLPDELFGGPEDNRAREVLAHLEGERHPLHEVKVILVGNGRAGKTSLARRLVGEPFDPHERSTHGILLWTLPDFPFTPIDAPGQEATARLHLWDFAGQDLYHSTHRLFYQSRAIYVVCETAAGDGADPDTDGTDDDGLPKGWDVDRRLAYWLDQIAAVGDAPGRNQPPPVLFVRTKVRRDGEQGMAERVAAFWREREELLRGRSLVDFDAESDAGLEDVRKWLAKAVAEVLGERERRQLSTDALRVRRALEARMAKNNAAHRKAERKGRKAVPPHPTCTRAEFDKLVRQHVRSGAYREDPGLLLDLLHTSGFLFADARHFPDTVVLDQRWAISAIYTAFDRNRRESAEGPLPSPWEELCAREGRCTLKELVQWGWHRYTPEQQRLFVRFMESCGMAFPLGDSWSGHKQEYVVVRALPPGAAVEREARDYRGDLEHSEKVRLAHRSLGRDAVLGVLARLGRQWGRSAVVWLYGGQFQSYRYELDRGPREPTFVHLNWQESAEGSFGGELTVTLYGADRSLLAAVLSECRQMGGFEKIDVPLIELPPEDPNELAATRLLGRGTRTETAGHAADDEHRNCIEIGISFAGDRGGTTRDWRSLPEDSRERWPLALAQWMREKLGFKVIEYRTEQAKDHHEKAPPRAFLERVASRDFVYVFASWDYLMSEWCMFEFWRLVQGCDGQDDQPLDPGRCAVAYFPNVLMSRPDARRGADNPVVRFQEHWSEWYKKERKAIDAEARATGWCPRLLRWLGWWPARRPDRFNDALRARSYSDWFECVRREKDFDRVLRALCTESHDRLAAVNPKAAEVEKMAQRAARSTARKEVLRKLALRAWNAKEEARALALFVQALLVEGGSELEQQDPLPTLSRPMGDHELDNLRHLVKGRLEDARASGQAVEDWRSLLDLLLGRT